MPVESDVDQADLRRGRIGLSGSTFRIKIGVELTSAKNCWIAANTAVFDRHQIRKAVGKFTIIEQAVFLISREGRGRG